jgi:hypothetical protein
LGLTAFGGKTAHRLTDVAHHFGRQVAAHYATDVIFPEDGFLHADVQRRPE